MENSVFRLTETLEWKVVNGHFSDDKAKRDDGVEDDIFNPCTSANVNASRSLEDYQVMVL